MKKEMIIKNKSDLIDFLVARRKKLKFSQTDLAQYSNLSRQSLSDIERGKTDPSLSKVITLLELCGVHIKLEVRDEGHDE